MYWPAIKRGVSATRLSSWLAFVKRKSQGDGAVLALALAATLFRLKLEIRFCQQLAANGVPCRYTSWALLVENYYDYGFYLC